MFYSKTAALAQHVGEITEILQEIYRDTDKKISDIELRNRAQCLILLGYTLRRRKTNKPFVPAEKSEWIQLYNNGACAMKDYCDMGMQVYVAKKCEDVKCLIVPGCAGGGGGGGGGGSNKSGGGGGGGGGSKGGGSDLLQDIKDKYKHATELNEKYNHDEMQIAFKTLSNAYKYISENCETMSGNVCEKAIFVFNLYYNLILDIEKILSLKQKELPELFQTLRIKIQQFCINELNEFRALSDENKKKMRNNFINANYLQDQLLIVNDSFYEILARPTTINNLYKLQDAAIFVCKLAKTIKENKISPDA
jgi:hypothetical protein